MRPFEIFMAWSAYFALHSLLSSSAAKAWIGQRWPGLMPGYRLIFNIVAVLALLPVLWLVYGTEADRFWQWKGAWAWVANGLALIALLCFFASTRAYDMNEFLGLSQLGARSNEDSQTFTLSFFHRFVRHPWYCFSLVLIWTRDFNMPLLVSVIAISIYLVVGSKLEERKLLAIYGEKYRRYMEKVPGLIPLPWKYLTASEAERLLDSRDQR